VQLPEPRLWFVEDRADEPASTCALQALHDVDGGVVVVRVSPGPHRLHLIAMDVLAALGKHHLRPGSVRAGEENWRRCTAWLAGEQTQHLIVDRAEILQAHQWELFIGLAAHCGLSLWLIAHGGSLVRSQREMLTDWPLTEIDFGQFIAEHAPQIAGGVSPAGLSVAAPVATRPFPELPHSDFTTFRADCRQLLTADAFERIDAEMQDAACRTRRWLADTAVADTAATYPYLRELIDECACTGQAVARLRAAQAVCLMEGLLVTVDLERLAATLEIARPVIDRQLVGQLREYSNTRRAAAALLTCLTGAAPAALTQMNVSDVNDNEVLVAGRTFAVPQVARGLLAAHVHQRWQAGARADDPLFADDFHGVLGDRLAPPSVRRAVEDVARASGLMLWGERRIKADPTNQGWMRRRGVSVKAI
jgi:hypothetical protein